MIKNYDILVLETNIRMIIDYDILKQYGFFLQEYVKEHYLEGCKAGFIKPVPLKDDKHILFINTQTKNKDIIIKTYFKCLSFAKIVNVKTICFVVNTNINNAILKSVIESWEQMSYLDYNFHIDMIYKNKIQDENIKSFEWFETGFIQKIYFETYDYMVNLNEDNVLVRNENYPIIKLSNVDLDIINFYNEINFEYID